jgi:hypothetical protein
MKQPTKAFLRAQMVTALEQNERLQRALAEPWWRRWTRRALPLPSSSAFREGNENGNSNARE